MNLNKINPKKALLANQKEADNYTSRVVNELRHLMSLGTDFILFDANISLLSSMASHHLKSVFSNE